MLSQSDRRICLPLSTRNDGKYLSLYIARRKSRSRIAVFLMAMTNPYHLALPAHSRGARRRAVSRRCGLPAAFPSREDGALRRIELEQMEPLVVDELPYFAVFLDDA